MVKKVNISKKKVQKSNKKGVNKKSVKMVEPKKFNLSAIIYIMMVVILVFGICLLFGVSFESKWVKNGNTISRGSETYQIGDNYYYDETNDGKIRDVSNVDWKVMDVDDEGHLLIVSEANTDSLTLGSEDDLEKAKNDFVTGEEQMNAICEKYGHGDKAIGARCISNQDIYNVFDMDVDSVESLNNAYTYYWGSNSDLVSISDSGEKKITEMHKDGNFIWYDETNKEWKLNVDNKENSNENPLEILYVKNTLEALNAYSFDENYFENFDENNNYLNDDKRIDMLFSTILGDPQPYWTIDSFTNAAPGFVAYGYNVVKGMDLNYVFLVYSIGKTRETTAGIRPVVTIK